VGAGLENPSPLGAGLEKGFYPRRVWGRGNVKRGGAVYAKTCPCPASLPCLNKTE